MTSNRVSRAHLPLSGWTLEVDESRGLFRLGRSDCWRDVEPAQEGETWGQLPDTWLAAFMAPGEGDREGWVLAYGALQDDGEVAAFVGAADVEEGPEGDWWQVPVLTVGQRFWVAEYEQAWLVLAITQGTTRQVFHRRGRQLRR
jgi:hypothetical protein